MEHSESTVRPLAERGMIEPDERFARVICRAIGILVAYWVSVQRLPPTHPYQQAARMVSSYLEKRYHV